MKKRGLSMMCSLIAVLTMNHASAESINSDSIDTFWQTVKFTQKKIEHRNTTVTVFSEQYIALEQVSNETLKKALENTKVISMKVIHKDNVAQEITAGEWSAATLTMRTVVPSWQKIESIELTYEYPEQNTGTVVILPKVFE